MAEINVYEPIKQYDRQYKKLHEKNVSDFFEELVKKSNVNEEENQETIKKIRKYQGLHAKTSDKQNTYKILKVITTVFIVVVAIVLLVFLLNLFNGNEIVVLWADILITIGLAGGIVGLVFLIVKKLNVILKGLQSTLDEYQKKIKEHEQISWQQMAPLNSLFDWGMPQELFVKTMPLITMDKYFDPKRYDILHNKYNLWDTSNNDQSVMYCQSGEILGNPFVIAKTLNTYVGTKTYTGTKTITWTQTISSGKGGTQTITRSQTLVATLTKPAPMYFTSTFLIYANEAAPDLKFSRTPGFVHQLSQKEVDNKVKRDIKDIQSKARKAVNKGSSFTQMSDDKFEVLFNALNRNHEVQYRLLFTPLGQREMLNILLDDKVGFGDDFDFIKENMLNVIKPKHLHEADIDTNPNKYVSNDIEIIRHRFNSFNNSFFKSIYFSFAPVLSIPLYQQHKPKEYIYKDSYPTNVSVWEHEAVVNGFDVSHLKHPLSKTLNILKSRFVTSAKDTDEVEVTAYGYEEIRQVTHVNKLGGDGRVHSIPVVWYLYQPVNQVSRAVIKTAKDVTRESFLSKVGQTDWQAFLKDRIGLDQQMIYKKNLVAYTTSTELNPLDIDNLNKLLYNNKEKKED